MAMIDQPLVERPLILCLLSPAIQDASRPVSHCIQPPPACGQGEGHAVRHHHRDLLGEGLLQAAPHCLQGAREWSLPSPHHPNKDLPLSQHGTVGVEEKGKALAGAAVSSGGDEGWVRGGWV